MGSGVSKQTLIPNLQEFKLIASEYDKLKAVGLSTEELHMILRKRMEDPQLQEEMKRQPQAYDSMPPSKGDGTPRAAEGANEPPNVESKVHESKDSSNEFSTEEEPQGPTDLVLLIDDSPVAARVAAKVLQQLNFEVVTASSAKMGFDILKARCEEIILVFLDVVMPHVDGVECLSWIKENADVSHIPVYMLSGLEDQLLADVCQERGAEGMLLKPLNQKIVIDIMKNHDIEVHPVANNKTNEKNKKQNNNAIKSSDAKSAHQSTVTEVSEHNHRVDDFKSTNEVSDTTRDSHPAAVDHLDDIAESKSPSTANNDQENIPNLALQRRNSTLSTAGAKITNKNLLSERCQAPAFKLCDSDMKMFSFPGSSTSKNFKHTYYAFIPSFFCSELYEEKGFLSQLFDFYDEILARKEEVVCISGDLPFALNAAKLRFNIPFTLLSDASLFVSQRFIGTIDIGSILARPTEDENTSTDHSKHIQNSSLGPHLGILYIHNKSREILKKWVSCDVELGEEPVLTKFPTDILTWTNKYGLDKNSKSKKETTTVRKKSNEKPPVKDHPSEPQTALKLLMVDDSSVSSRVASKKLEAKGYDVTIAYNGQIAYDILKKDPKSFNIVLTDVVMPVCDGMELLRLIKADEELLHLPVFMLSGLEGDTLSKNCLQAGAAMLLKKPFNDEIFHDFVQKFFVENS